MKSDLIHVHSKNIDDPNLASDQTGEGMVRTAVEEIPGFGQPMEVARGIWWIRLPNDSALDHVNVYVLEDLRGWTLIDTGSNSADSRAALLDAFKHRPLSARPISRVIATHHHPDHIGLAGLMVGHGATLWASRVCWLTARLLQIDDRDLPCEEQVRFVQRAGVKAMSLAAYKRQRPSNYAQQVYPLPFSYQAMDQGDQLTIGGRTWTVHIGNGHAMGHVTLWSNDGLAITGDQILPGIASNLSVHASEPDADLVSPWLESCRHFHALASDHELCLPGHNPPFKGARTRCDQLMSNVSTVLERLLKRVERPCTAVECLDTVYRRPLRHHEHAVLTAEVVGFLNHLECKGLVSRELTRDDVYLWRRTANTVGG